MSQAAVTRAIEDLREGKFVLIYDADGREEETDMVLPSQFATPQAIRMLREDAGGLICTTLSDEVSRKLGIPYLTDIYRQAAPAYPVLAELMAHKPSYDARSAFAITINHRKTFTGITDVDRALTIGEFARLVQEADRTLDGIARKEFIRDFRAPGHVTLLNASRGLLKTRRGHTELATALMILAGLFPSATICEMIGANRRALGEEEAQEYARSRGLIFLEGEDILHAWESWSES